MPRQTFSVPDAPDAPLVTITWTGAHRDVEVSAGGTLLTRIDDPASLRATGLRGTAPDGADIVLKLVDTGVSQEFRVLRNDTPLLGSVVIPDASSGVPAAVVDQTQREMLQRRARTWLKVMGVLVILGALALIGLAGSDSMPSNLTASTGQLRTIGVITLVIGSVFLGLATMAKGARARQMFAVAASLTGLLAVANLASAASNGGSGVVGTVLPAITCVQCVKAYRAS